MHMNNTHAYKHVIDIYIYTNMCVHISIYVCMHILYILYMGEIESTEELLKI